MLGPSRLLGISPAPLLLGKSIHSDSRGSQGVSEDLWKACSIQSGPLCGISVPEACSLPPCWQSLSHQGSTRSGAMAQDGSGCFTLPSGIFSLRFWTKACTKTKSCSRKFGRSATCCTKALVFKTWNQLSPFEAQRSCVGRDSSSSHSPLSLSLLHMTLWIPFPTAALFQFDEHTEFKSESKADASTNLWWAANTLNISWQFITLLVYQF